MEENKENTINQRIKALLRTEGISVNKLADGANIKQPSLNKQINGDTNISLETLLLIKERIPNSSIEWIITGEGDMYKNNNTSGNKSFFEKIISALPTCGDEQFYEEQLEEKDKKIRYQAKEISRLNAIIESLKEQLS